MAAMETEFPLRYPNPQSRAMARIAHVNLILVTAGPIVLAALGTVTWRSLEWTVPVMWVLIGLHFARFGLMKGKALVDMDGVSMKAWSVRQSYPWRDIQAIELTTLRERDRWTRWWTSVCGGSLDERLIQLTLRKLPKVALFHFGWGERMGTDVIGIPAIGAKRIIIPVRDPEAFVTSAADYLAVLGLPTGTSSAMPAPATPDTE